MSELLDPRPTKDMLWSLSAKQLAVIRSISGGAMTIDELGLNHGRPLTSLIQRGLVIETVNGYLRLSLAGLLVAKTDTEKRGKP